MSSTLSSSGSDHDRGVMPLESSPAAAIPIGLTTAQARHRRGEFGPNIVGREAAAALAEISRKVLGARSVDA